MDETSSLPKAFIWRRLHSLTGIFITIYLFEHLLVNSQAALFFGDDGSGFVQAVKSIHELPYLPLIEIFLLGVPIILHAWWGVIYLRTSKQNYYGVLGKECYLPQYTRNRAYTWQRITSWILLVGIFLHVAHMRFYEYPASAQIGSEKDYMVRLNMDNGLYTLAERLNFKIFDKNSIARVREEMLETKSQNDGKPGVAELKRKQTENWIKALELRPLKQDQVIAVSSSFGIAELLMVRETFKMPLMIALYTIFVLAACYHGFNGLWTFMISWGITLTPRSQMWMLKFSYGLMFLVAFMGLAAIWGTYWINLKQ